MFAIEIQPCVIQLLFCTHLFFIPNPHSCIYQWLGVYPISFSESKNLWPRGKCARDNGSSACHYTTRVNFLWSSLQMGEQRWKQTKSSLKKRKKTAHMCRTCCSFIQENHGKEIPAAPLSAVPGPNTIVRWWSHIGCCKSPSEIQKIRGCKRVPIGRGRGRVGRAARSPALMDVVLSQYVFRKFSLFQLPHLFANCHVFSCLADDWLFKKASGKVEQALCLLWG